MTSIAIVGSGISGLQLALRLQQLGVDSTLYSSCDADELAGGRPRNFAARFGPTQAREHELDVFAWPEDDARVFSWLVEVCAPKQPRLTFHASLTPPSSVVDFRLYLPHLMRSYIARGGAVEVGIPPIGDIAVHHDLVVVANGDRSMRELFPTDPSRSPYIGPQRIICSGLYTGISEAHPHSVDLHMLPGVGEIFRIPFLSPHGRVDVLALEAVPGGPLDGPLGEIDPDAEPQRFQAALLQVVAEYAPTLRERIDDSTFELVAPGEYVRGGITPTVRRSWTELAGGTCALAIGDAWITNDPLTAQGANLGSASAFILADLIAVWDGPLDSRLCRAAATRLWDHADDVVAWSNAFLAPPAQHVVDVLVAAAQDRAVADRFVSNFHDPSAMWRSLATPEGAAQFLTDTRAKETS